MAAKDYRIVLMDANGFRFRYDISTAPTRIRDFIAATDSRILKPEFYEKGLGSRIVTLTPFNVLKAHGELHRPFSPLPGIVLSSEMNLSDRRLSLTEYGHPNNDDVFIKWLNGMCDTIDEVTKQRNERAELSLKKVDRSIDTWIKNLPNIVHTGIDKYVEKSETVRHGWVFNWKTISTFFGAGNVEAVRIRLIDRAKQARCLSIREYLQTFEPGKVAVDLADDFIDMTSSQTMNKGFS